MSSNYSHKTLNDLANNYLSNATLSLKAVSKDLLQTNRIPDVLRICRTQELLDYDPTGRKHYIKEIGYEYFSSDKERREKNLSLFPFENNSDFWKNNAGSEIFLTGRSALKLRRDYFDDTIMLLIDPPRGTNKNISVEETLFDRFQFIESQDYFEPELFDESNEDFGLLKDPVDEFNSFDIDPDWQELAFRMARNGNESGARAIKYLTNPRTMALLNELASRVGIDLMGDERKNLLYRFCSFQMRKLLDENGIFLISVLEDKYFDNVANFTVDLFLGFNPNSVPLRRNK
tara:strand:- start:2164 stop:3030 length:867 start_codon:yes stop_codon:yes gene_type:complete